MNYDLIKKQLTLHEGRKNKPYKCTAGKTTIGVGRNLDDNGLSDDEIDYLLMNDVRRCEKELQQRFSWYQDQPDSVQMVLVDMCFNLGITRLMGFKNTLAMIGEGNYHEAAIEMLNSNWAVQVGQRAVTLARMLKNAGATDL